MTERASVPCGDCFACCRHKRVILTDEEVKSGRYDIVPTRKGFLDRTRWMLPHKPNGECIYLGNFEGELRYGCTIHDHAPAVCQMFDCRKWIKLFNEHEVDAILSDGLDRECAEAALARME